MKTKKIIAFALSCAMVLSTFPASVLADGDNVLKPGVTEATKPTLKAVYMREKMTQQAMVAYMKKHHCQGMA